jgi:class 3 adenylate cyclase
VVVDEQFAAALSPSAPVRAVPLGARRLRGFAEPVPLFALEVVDDAS